MTLLKETENIINKYKNEEYYVAYLDFLGTKQIVNNDTTGKYLNDLNIIFRKSLEEKEYLNLYMSQNNKIFSKIFSDNILLAMLADKYNYGLNQLINLCSLIQNYALMEGYLIRGAIVIGKFYHDDVFVYGKALIDAERLERENAIYPRIIIRDRDAKNIIINYLERDRDSFLFVNNYNFTSDYIQHKQLKDKLIEYYYKYKNDDKIRQKIIWSICYHNAYLKKLKNYTISSRPLITNEELSK